MVTRIRQRVDLTDALVAQADLGEWEEADDPTLDTNVGDIIHLPDADWGAPIGVAEKSGPGWVTIYATLDGEPRVINKTNLDSTMKKVHPVDAPPNLRGRPAFSRVPTMPYALGTHKCRLHPSDDHAALYRSWGLAVCHSEHFPSEYEVRTHMQMDHKREWASIREYEQEQRSERERKEQNDIFRMLAAGRGLPDDAPPVAQVVPDHVTQPRARKPRPTGTTQHSHRDAMNYKDDCARCQELAAARAAPEA